MITKKYITRVTAAVLTVAMIVTPAHAVTFVDPINLIQNTFSARAEIKSEISAARTLIEQINAAKSLARSAAGLKDLRGLAGVDKARQLYGALVELDGRLDKNLDESGKFAQDLRAQYGASNMSWDQFASTRSRMETNQQQASRERYASVARSMEETTRRRQEIVSQLSAVEGQTQAMQALGAALDVIIGQNQQIIATMVATSKEQAAKAAPDQSQQQWAENQRALYQKRVREAASKF